MMRGLIVGAARSGAGKTTVTLGLLAALRRRGVAVRAAKSGPDYIDPAFHAAATALPVLGAIPRDTTLGLPGRHLGLVQGGEHHALAAHLVRLADLAERHLDLDAILAAVPPGHPPPPPPGGSRHQRQAGVWPTCPVNVLSADKRRRDKCQRKRNLICEFNCIYGAPGKTRTSNPQIRSLVLYPIELRAQPRAGV
jgi:hypothetical protein